jgi:hypothetical protein
MRGASVRTKSRLGFFFLGLLVFAVGHTFLISPQTAQAAAPLHHDLAQHESEDEHVACPTDIHQFLNIRDQGITDELGAVSLDLVTPVLSLCDVVEAAVFGHEAGHYWLPLDHKTVLRI